MGAVTSPMPDDAPVITITWSESSLCLAFMHSSPRGICATCRPRFWPKFFEIKRECLYSSDTPRVFGPSRTIGGAATEDRPCVEIRSHSHTWAATEGRPYNRTFLHLKMYLSGYATTSRGFLCCWRFRKTSESRENI